MELAEEPSAEGERRELPAGAVEQPPTGGSDKSGGGA
jgi:hypothetical protein